MLKCEELTPLWSGNRTGMIPQVEEFLSESFFHPETGPAAPGQVVIDNCRSTKHHACGSPKERAGRREERANPNDCQQQIMSRKNCASHKHHKIKQLQQIITAARHEAKTKTVNISLFFLAGFPGNFKDGLRIFPCASR
jgi:hypothetical protein